MYENLRFFIGSVTKKLKNLEKPWEVEETEY